MHNSNGTASVKALEGGVILACSRYQRIRVAGASQ